MGRRRSFLQSFTWVWMMLLGMGIVFLGIAIVMQLVPISPSNMTLTVNGVRQPATEETVRIFRLVFLLAFGIFGLVMAAVGGVIAWRGLAQRKLAERLKEEGVRLTAEVTEYAPSNVRINYRNIMRLRCTYTDLSGRSVIFQSGLLRADPMPYLQDGQVTVYCDKDNMSRYFVDVDESVGLGTRVVEL